MACATHGVNALCDSTCDGFIWPSQPASAPAFDPRTAVPPFASYQQLVEAYAAQHGLGAPTEAFAREQGWLADDEPDMQPTKATHASE